MKETSSRGPREPSFTSRHATEFTGVDVELAWIDDVELAWIDSAEDVMNFEERMLAHVIAAVAAAHGAAIEEHFKTEVTVPRIPFPRLALAEALSLCGTGSASPGRADLDRRASGPSRRGCSPRPGTSSRS